MRLAVRPSPEDLLAFGITHCLVRVKSQLNGVDGKQDDAERERCLTIVRDLCRCFQKVDVVLVPSNPTSFEIDWDDWSEYFVMKGCCSNSYADGLSFGFC